MNELPILLSILATSLLAGIGALLLFLRQEQLQHSLIYLVAISTGAMFGGTFIHLIPKYANTHGYTHLTGLIVLSGIALSHLLEKLLHWHCHRFDHSVEPFSYMILIGDSFHNILDGILIASSYLASISAGTAATIAVALHKIPKEVGDFGTLVHGGFSERKALLFNISVSAFMFIGAGLVILLSGFQNAETVLIPFTIGNFVYIAGTDLFPEIKEHSTNRQSALTFLSFLLGVGMMYSIVLLKPFFA